MTDIALSTVVPKFSIEQLEAWNAPEWLTMDEAACLIVGIPPSEYEYSWYLKQPSQIGFDPKTTYPIYNIRPIQQLLFHEVSLFKNGTKTPKEECFFSVDDIKEDESGWLDSYCFRRSAIPAWLIQKGIESKYFQTAGSEKVNSLDPWKAVEWINVETLSQLICDFSPDEADLIEQLNSPIILSEFREESHSFVECKKPDFLTPIERRLDEEIRHYHMASKFGDRGYRSIFTSDNVRFKSYPSNTDRNSQIRYLEYNDDTGEGGEYQVRQSCIRGWLKENDIKSHYFGTKPIEHIENSPSAIDAREKTTYLIVIAALLKAQNIDWTERGMASVICEGVDKVECFIDEDTVRNKILKQIPEALKKRKKPN